MIALIAVENEIHLVLDVKRLGRPHNWEDNSQEQSLGGWQSVQFGICVEVDQTQNGNS